MNTEQPKRYLSATYITGRNYIDLQMLSELDVYERMCGYAVDLSYLAESLGFFWKQCEARDVELMLDVTGNLDAKL